VTETHLGLAAVVAGVVVGDELGTPSAVDADTALADVIHEQIEHRDETELFQRFRKVGFEPGPGCEVGVPSLRPHQGVYPQRLHLV